MTIRTGAAAPRAVGSDYGGYHGRSVGTAKLYGSPDDRCPVCDALLNAYNQYDRCATHCRGNERRRPPREGGASASAAGEAGTNAAPEPRRTTQEEIEMAADERQKASETRAAIDAACGRRDGWFMAKDIATEVGCPLDMVHRRLRRLVEDGKFTSSRGRGYCIRCQEPVQNPAEAESIKNESPAHEAVSPGQNPDHQKDAERAIDHGRALHEPESAVDDSGRSGDALDVALGALTAYGSHSSEVEECATSAPVSPPGAAPEAPPERSSAATPVPPAVPQGSPAAESLRTMRGFAGISPFAGQLIQPDALLVTSDPELVVINYLAAMAPEQRDRTLQFAVAKWWPFEKEA